ncbi:MAG: hypothetical protein IH599_07165, partial [Bacteroidales bacterium]|nr:hypothetical protein [Bacteroidales bacterium]
MKSTRNISAILIASLLFLATGPVSWAQPSVTIGTGTTTTYYLPTYGLYDYSWGVSIYLASEMAGYSGTISSISWYVVKPAGYSYTMLDQRIYLMHTTETIFPTTAAPTNAGMT